MRKRNSIVGDAMARFEGSAAADQFARRHSTYTGALRQSIPDIRFDAHGVPVSTRQLLGRSHSLADPHAVLASGVEFNIRRLSKSTSGFSEDALDAGEAPKPNFTLPTVTRAGMLGSNRRWSIRPDWMSNKRRRSSAKEEFIEKNLQNIEIPPPKSPHTEPQRSWSEDGELSTTPESETTHTLEDIADESEESSVIDSDSSTDFSASEEETKSELFLSCLSSEPEDEITNNVNEAKDDEDEIFVEVAENAADIVAFANGFEEHTNDAEPGEKNKHPVSERRRHSKSERRKSHRRKSRDGRRASAAEDTMPPRPPPPPLLLQMCRVQDQSSSSDEQEEDTVLTQYGRQRMFVSTCHHVFQFSDGVEVRGCGFSFSFCNVLDILQ